MDHGPQLVTTYYIFWVCKNCTSRRQSPSWITNLMKNTWYPTTMIAFWRPNISLGFQTPCCLENLDPQNIYLYLSLLLSEVFGRHRVFINYEKQNSPSNHPLTTIPPPTSRLEMAGSVLLAPRHRRRTAN